MRGDGLERAASVIELRDGARLQLRPLAAGDIEPLARFLAGLSAETRALSSFPGYDRAAANELCEAIGRYDKHRFVLIAPAGEVAALFEFSLDLPAADVARYRAAGVMLDERSDCRFGPTVADGYQGRGAASAAFPLLVERARSLGQRRILLWGGVLARNERAVAFYAKQGFRRVGGFLTPEGEQALDMLLDLQ